MYRKLMIFSMIGLMFLLSACKTTPDEVETVDYNELYPKHGVYYEIFVRSFADSDGDGVGDFRGIADKLDYLKDLGVEGLWLMPIHPSDSYHGYDVLDFYDVNEDYGTMEDFEYLLEEAHKKDMKIIIDLVINHTSSQHEWFIKSRNNDEEYRDWYTWINTMDERYDKYRSLWHGSGTYYASYFGSGMPELNMLNADVRDEILNIGQFWTDLGVDGFRIDAAVHLFGVGEVPIGSETISASVDFLNFFQQRLSYTNPDIYIVSETWTDYNTYSFFFEGIDSTFNFSAANILQGVANSVGNKSMVEDLFRMYRNFEGKNESFIDAPFLTNHDMNRIATIVDGSKEKIIFSAETYLFLPGNPFIYYGEEIGAEGDKTLGTNGVWDESRRLPLDFGDAYTTTWFDINYRGFNETVDDIKTQLEDPTSILNAYKNILEVRNNSLALSYGGFTPYLDGNSFALQGYYRYFEHEDDQQLVLVYHNLSNSDKEISEFENYNVLYYTKGNDSFENGTLSGKSTLVVELPYELKVGLIGE